MSLRSRRKRKAQGGAGSPAGQPRWGAEAKRNPGINVQMIDSPRSG
jgi:hypothetical protein